MRVGAPPHIYRHAKQLLRQHFTDAQSSASFSNGMIPSFDRYRPLQFLVLGHQINICHQRSASVPDLKDSTRHHILDIPADSLRPVVENMDLRLQNIADYDGGYIERFYCYFSIEHLKNILIF